MQPYYILIADDDELIRWHLRHILARHGGAVIYSAGSVEQIKSDPAINYGLIDMAIVDYDYGSMRENGLSLISHLKANGVRKVHLCTAFFDDAEVREAAHAAGVDSIIPKPFEEENIAQLCSKN